MSSLFLQSEVKNPYTIYQKMIKENPVYWDETNKIWAIYSYEFCVEILKNPDAQIPAFPPNEKLNEYVLKIIANLARLSDGVQHMVAKETATILFSHMKTSGIQLLLEKLFQKNSVLNQINWVDSICKKLPVLTVLKSFDFDEEDCLFIIENIAVFLKIMQPVKTDEEVEMLNDISKKIYLITEKHIRKLSFYESLLDKISSSYTISKEAVVSICVSNLIGLIIQSYDAGRGLLSNSLLQFFLKENPLQNQIDKTWIEKMVIETLRFDPPIHNTRRVAVANIELNGITIKKDDLILVVLAAANRDPDHFGNSIIFDVKRENNNEHLTFGAGGHMCLAKYFSVQLATEALYYLFTHYKVSLLGNEAEYEPMINARLPKAIWISIL
ncbi:cytochrome P450 [Flavobacterium sp. 1355]|uniref:cytochrome P450 n=1 Tax=Flavobacterium sp. 1355 TaxID=2806571 RepID=UPI001AE4D4A7|nr:cytochrome P450 [Flavobacterium sp. 1355]MBP1224824.1 cytochrome P450 [Flavobacterium sp. 1355]